MSNAVIARQQGDDYQAKFFWYKACNLYRQNSTAVKVAWEFNDSPGFDDVSIYYNPAILDKTSGLEIHSEFFQVKFHVDHSKGFTCDALMDPAFIGNTTESLLQRLHKNLKKDPVTFNHSRFYIINTWGIDHSDTFKKLVDNNGAIRMDVLFDGTTTKTIMGVIRTKWQNHLGLATDDELKIVLAPLRIHHGAKGIESFTEDLNYRLAHVGLQTISETQRASVYTDLIQQLHAQKRNVFTKEELMDILQKEKLVVEKAALKEDVYRIGIRSFKKGTDTIAFETDVYLCLLHHFSGRFILDEKLWKSEVVIALGEFAEKVASQPKPLHIHLDTHHAIAFAFGYFLDSKSGVSTAVIQKTRNGRILFKADHTSPDYLKYEAEENWIFNEIKNTDGASDIAVVLNVTHDIKKDVEEFISCNLSGISRLIFASIIGGPSGISIKDGNHIFAAVQQLITKLRVNRTTVEKNGFIHLFIAAPNALIFALGQNIKSLGKMKLYEYDFENNRNGTYNLAIQLPIDKI